MGCPLAAAAFALTLHKALSTTSTRLTATTPNTTTTGYMDDISIITHHTNIRNALDTITATTAELGLQLNTTKTECWVHPTAVLPSEQYYNVKRTTRPIVLKTSADPLPVTPDSPATATPYHHDQAPENQQLLAKRTHTATRPQ